MYRSTKQNKEKKKKNKLNAGQMTTTLKERLNSAD
jgi:hypothetical protein